MADKTPKESPAPFATRINPDKDALSREQIHFIRQVELEQWRKKVQKLRTRNVVTGFAIGALVVGICILVQRQHKGDVTQVSDTLGANVTDGYTFYSVSQERIMDEIDEEAKRARLQGPKTGAN